MKKKSFFSLFAWLFDAPSDPSNIDMHFNTGRHYQKPCVGAVRCPQADDVTCEECKKVQEMEIKEALVCDSCAKASAYACERCLGGNA